MNRPTNFEFSKVFFEFFMRKYRLVDQYHVVTIDVIFVLRQADGQFSELNRVVVSGFIRTVLNFIH